MKQSDTAPLTQSESFAETMRIVENSLAIRHGLKKRGPTIAELKQGIAKMKRMGLIQLPDESENQPQRKPHAAKNIAKINRQQTVLKNQTKQRLYLWLRENPGVTAYDIGELFFGHHKAGHVKARLYMQMLIEENLGRIEVNTKGRNRYYAI